jgi:hypothetical protein
MESLWASWNILLNLYFCKRRRAFIASGEACRILAPAMESHVAWPMPVWSEIPHDLSFDPLVLLFSCTRNPRTGFCPNLSRSSLRFHHANFNRANSRHAGADRRFAAGRPERADRVGQCAVGRRQRLDADLLGAGAADDRPWIGAVLRRSGAQKKTFWAP